MVARIIERSDERRSRDLTRVIPRDHGGRPECHVRPMVKGGGGGKAGDHGVDVREGSKQATLSSCGEGTAMDKAGNYGFGTRWSELFYEDLTSILEACEIEEEEKTSGGAATLHTPVLEITAAGSSAHVRPMVTNGGGGKAGNQSDIEDARPGTGICKGADGEVGSDNEAGADRPSPT